MPFRDRIEAGRALAHTLVKYRGQAVAVYALPRGGVQVAGEIAAALNAPLDVLLVRKIGAPMQPELAIGAVVDGGRPIIVRNSDIMRLTGVTNAEFDKVCERELAEIERRRMVYAKHPPLNPRDKIAIVVDDGIATGATMHAALRSIRMRSPKRLVLAVPVASRDSIERLQPEVDEIACLEMPEDFGALGYYYQDFHQLSDQDVINTLNRFPERTAAD